MQEINKNTRESGKINGDLAWILAIAAAGLLWYGSVGDDNDTNKKPKSYEPDKTIERVVKSQNNQNQPQVVERSDSQGGPETVIKAPTLWLQKEKNK